MHRILAAVAAALAIALSAQAQTYPSRVVRLVVPFAPGGSSEIIARTLAHRLAENLGQQFIVENKPGGRGNVAVGSTPAEFAEFIHKEQARWGEVVRKSGVKAE